MLSLNSSPCSFNFTHSHIYINIYVHTHIDIVQGFGHCLTKMYLHYILLCIFLFLLNKISWKSLHIIWYSSTLFFQICSIILHEMVYSIFYSIIPWLTVIPLVSNVFYLYFCHIVSYHLYCLEWSPRSGITKAKNICIYYFSICCQVSFPKIL